ncbi:hypothetical protein NHX12_025514 [Muraenolepis orangiensis]|uniref:Cadherin domain-containing protein n=1 Tax=Muraenolepis orangiensis TaxID=630683 RepID=A0A9Q0EIE3_9TELE|nr:hypothetical protein NHX12_025514 [Muraenolepis orangiensis]
MKREERTLVLWVVLHVAHLSSGQSDYAPCFHDNGPSSIQGNMALFSIAEDTPVGTHVYTLNGTDPEDDPVRYGLTFQKGSTQYFRVDPESGNVTLVRELDREKQAEISALVSITDGRNNVIETVRIFVTDANDEQPEFRNLPFIIEIPEDAPPGSSVYKVQALDRDMGSGGSISYYLQSSKPSKFTIDGHSGVLRIRTNESLDYEATPTHFVTVVAKDGGGRYQGLHQVMSSIAIITVHVVDAQDTPPSFVGTPYFGYIYEVSLPGSEIFTVYAKDGDQGNPNPIHYSIINGSDGVFAINSSSGIITLTTDPGQLRSELYQVRVKASEVGGSEEVMDYDVTTVTVRVVDLNNHPPTFYGENGPQNLFEVTMLEHPPAGEILRGLKITVNDSDQGANAKFKLRLLGPGGVLRVGSSGWGPPGGVLRVVPQTVLNEAQVTVIVEDTSGIDYEKSATLSFKLLAVELDTPERFSATADILIHLLDTNDNIPSFTKQYYIAHIPENSPGGSSLLAITAIDPDSGPWGEVKYTICGSGSDLFSIHSSSGLISTQPWASLDAEARSKYNFYVKAEDGEGQYSLAEVFVTVLDLNDHSPAFQDTLMEQNMIIGAVDEDAESPNNVIQYSIMKADPDNVFVMDGDTGDIRLKPFIKSMEILHNISQQQDCSWSLLVEARDRGSPSFSTTAVLHIDITEAIRGRVVWYFLGLRQRPLAVFGMCVSVVVSLVLLTICISTVLYCSAVKKSRISPERNYIKVVRRAK